MFKQCTMALAFLAFCGLAAGVAAETITVEVYFAPEHVPNGLKAGSRVDLVQVVGKSVTASGQVSYSTSGVAKDMTVVSVTTVEKPKTPEQAVKVELQVTKAQGAAIARAKTRRVTVTVTTSDGQTKTEQRPIPLRLQLTKMD